MHADASLVCMDHCSGTYAPARQQNQQSRASIRSLRPTLLPTLAEDEDTLRQQQPRKKLARPAIIYGLRHKGTGRWYVGQTIQDLSRRLSQHAGTPPALMMPDLARFHGTFREQVEVHVLQEGCTHARDAHEAEMHWIREKHSRQPDGYNVVEGSPMWTRQYHAIVASQKKRRQQAHDA